MRLSSSSSSSSILLLPLLLCCLATSSVSPTRAQSFTPTDSEVPLDSGSQDSSDLQEFNDYQASIWLTMIPKFQPYLANTPLTPEMQRKTFLEILYNNNVTQLKHIALAQFDFYSRNISVETTVTLENGTKLVENKFEQAIRYRDLKRQYKDQLGFWAYLGSRMFDGLGKDMRREFKAMDRDGNGAVTYTEYEGFMIKQFSDAIALPADYMAVCDGTNAAIQQCFGDDSPNFDRLIERQQALCRSGLSWLASQMTGELMILQAATNYTAIPTANSTITTPVIITAGCQERIRDVLFGNVQVQPPIESLDAPKLRKRALVVAAPVSATFFGIFGVLTNPLAIIGLTVVAAFIVMIILSGLGKASSSKQNHQLWLSQQQFERWQFGGSLPPCNTPIIYWSPQCGALNSDRASSCPRGQPYKQGACKGWWKDGGRLCNFLGCQALCVDIVTESCPADMKPYMVQYINGTSAVVPQP